jgi:hypothetical protein
MSSLALDGQRDRPAAQPSRVDQAPDDATLAFLRERRNTIAAEAAAQVPGTAIDTFFFTAHTTEPGPEKS